MGNLSHGAPHTKPLKRSHSKVYFKFNELRRKLTVVLHATVLALWHASLLAHSSALSFTFHFSFMGKAVFGKAQHVPVATVATFAAWRAEISRQTAKRSGGDLLTSPTRLCPVLAVDAIHTDAISSSYDDCTSALCIWPPAPWLPPTAVCRINQSETCCLVSETTNICNDLFFIYVSIFDNSALLSLCLR